MHRLRKMSVPRPPSSLVLVLGHTPTHSAETADHLRPHTEAEVVDCGSDLSRATEILDSRSVAAVVAASGGEEAFLSEDLDPLVSAASEEDCPVLLTGAATPHLQGPAARRNNFWALAESASSDHVKELLRVLAQQDVDPHP